MTEERTCVAARVGQFARVRVRHSPALAGPDGAFPEDLWSDMAATGLLGLGVPESFGGLGTSLAEQAAAATALAGEGRSLGFTVAWQSHNTLSRFFFDGFGSPEQKRKWLPALAAGRVSPAVAISEPGAGAHPKHLSTSATSVDGGFVLNGEKAFVTNGPRAGVLVVVAVSAIESGRKRFTAFIVDRDAPGLSATDAGYVDGLHPVGHCGFRFEDCRVGTDAILGRPGAAYDDMAQPLRDHEDMLGLGTLAGGMRAAIDNIAESAAAPSFAPEVKERLGSMIAAQAALAVLGRIIVGGGSADDKALLLGTRRIVQVFLADLDALAERCDPAPAGLDSLRRDLSTLSGVARQVSRLRLQRLAETVLSRPA